VKMTTMIPILKTPLGQLYEGDCIEIMQSLEASSCRDSWDHVPIRSWPLFKARHVLRTLLINDNRQPVS
jgi:hypothetical protein